MCNSDAWIERDDPGIKSPEILNYELKINEIFN
jgi:hypothetical protein